MFKINYLFIFERPDKLKGSVLIVARPWTSVKKLYEEVHELINRQHSRSVIIDIRKV